MGQQNARKEHLEFKELCSWVFATCVFNMAAGRRVKKICGHATLAEILPDLES